MTDKAVPWYRRSAALLALAAALALMAMVGAVAYTRGYDGGSSQQWTYDQSHQCLSSQAGGPGSVVVHACQPLSYYFALSNLTGVQPTTYSSAAGVEFNFAQGNCSTHELAQDVNGTWQVDYIWMGCP